MTYELIYEFMYMKNIVKSYLKSCVPRFQIGASDKSQIIVQGCHCTTLGRRIITLTLYRRDKAGLCRQQQDAKMRMNDLEQPRGSVASH